VADGRGVVAHEAEIKDSGCTRRFWNQRCVRGCSGISAACEAVLAAEIILFRKNALLGMIFHRRNHPDSEESSPRDDFPQKKASCFRRILFQG